MSREAGIAALGYFPMPPHLMAPVCTYLRRAHGGGQVHILDTCGGEGKALHALQDHLGANTVARAVELHAERAAQCASLLGQDRVICADALTGVEIAPDAFGLLWLNPPYHLGQFELEFLMDHTPLLCAGGVLCLVVPRPALRVLAEYLAAWYGIITCYAFPAPDYRAYKQVVLFGERKPTPCPNELQATRLRGLAEPDADLPTLGAYGYTYVVPATPGSAVFGLRQAEAVPGAGGLWDDADLAARLWPALTPALLRPLMPLARGHLAQFGVSGLLRNTVLHAQDGTPYLVKGRAIKARTVREWEEENEQKKAVSVRVTRESAETGVTLFNLRTGDWIDVRPGTRERSLGWFVEEFGASLTRAILDTCPPIYTPALYKQYRPLVKRLARQPLGRQADALAGAALALERGHRCTILSCEMGTGKTYMALAALYAAWRRRRERDPQARLHAVVICPTHLVRKWVREAKQTIPGVQAVAVDGISEIEVALRQAHPGAPLILVLSKERAKLGHPRRPAVWDRLLPQSKERRLCCPQCGEIIRYTETCGREGKERLGVPIVDAQVCVRYRLFCANDACRSPLWQSDTTLLRVPQGQLACLQPAGRPVALFAQGRTVKVSGGGEPRRVPLGAYIARRLRGAIDVLVLDECFPAGTPVATARGDIAIEDLRPGDRVLSLSHGAIVERTVTRTISKRLTGGLVNVTHSGGTLTCTPNHKVYTERGYVPAGMLRAGDILHSRQDGPYANDHEDVSGLRDGLPLLASPAARAGSVQPLVRERVAPAQASDLSAAEMPYPGQHPAVCLLPPALYSQEGDARLLQPQLQDASVLVLPAEQNARVTARQNRRSAGHIIGPHGTPEPRSDVPDAGEGTLCSDTAYDLRAGWQWIFNATTDPATGCSWMDGRAWDRDGRAVMAVRAGGPSVPGVEDSGGVRRRPASDPAAARTGSAQGADGAPQGLDSTPVLEQPDRAGSAGGAGVHRDGPVHTVHSVEPVDAPDDMWVYDLEVEDTHCYFAANVLVSNCHEYKADGSAQGIIAGQLAAAIPQVLALTGTLYGGYASSLFHLLYRLDPATREEFAYTDLARWIDSFGLYEITEKETERDGDEIGYYTRRKTNRVTTRKEIPGLMPQLIARLARHTIFLRLADVAPDLPPYEEHVTSVAMLPAQQRAYDHLKNALLAALREALVKGSKRLLGAYLQSLLAYPDAPYRDEVVIDPKDDHVIAQAPALDAETVYPKEQVLLDLIVRELGQRRKVLVYIQHTGSRDVTTRLVRLLAERHVKAAVLHSSVEAKKREAWVEARLKEGVQVLLTHPKCVQTGLDLLDFPTLVFWQCEYSAYVVGQASRRSWRIGQRHAVHVYHMIYADSLQETALRLVARKRRAAKLVDGDLDEDGLVAQAEMDGLLKELARSLVDEEATAGVESTAEILAQSHADDLADTELIVDTVSMDDEDMVEADAALPEPVEAPVLPTAPVGTTISLFDYMAAHPSPARAGTRARKARRVVPAAQLLLFAQPAGDGPGTVADRAPDGADAGAEQMELFSGAAR